MSNDEEHVEEVVGEPAPDDYVKELTELKNLVSYEKGIEKLENFSKWLFSSTSFIAALAAGYSVTGFKELNATGDVMYGICLLLVTVSLVLSAFSLTPRLFNYNPNSKESIQNAIEQELIINRGKKLRWAGTLFGFAILFAGLAPLSSKFIQDKQAQYLNVSYESYKDSTVSLLLNSNNLAPFRNVQLVINKYYDSKHATLFQSGFVTNADGIISESITLKNVKAINPFDSLLVRCSWYTSASTRKDTVIKIFYNES